MSTKYYKIQSLPSVIKERAVPQPSTLYSSSPSLDQYLSMRRVAIVGSRKPSTYGRAITHKIATELANYGILIISGLALGIDSIAHTAAVEANKPTLAVLPSSITNVYPRSHSNLARNIIGSGGALISEYEATDQIHKSNFIARNRLIAALSEMVIITEAAEKSGSLHTAQFALEQGIDVMAVPGEITSALSKGTNNLIKNGAGVITDTKDILEALGISEAQKQTRLFHNALSEDEKIIVTLLERGIKDGGELLIKSNLRPEQFQQAITMLEINGVITSLGNHTWASK